MSVNGSVVRHRCAELGGIALVVFFLVSLLLDRFSGWHVSSSYPLAAGAGLVALSWRDRPHELGRFFLCLLALIAWMLLRDVATGGDWRAGERTLKAGLLALGLIAGGRMDYPAWSVALRWAACLGVACTVAYIGPRQVAAGLVAPLAMAVTGFSSEMNRNALAVPLGLLACWVVLACRSMRSGWPGWLWSGLVVLVLMLMLANGSRNAILSLALAVSFSFFLFAPRRAVLVAFICAGALLLMLCLWPSFWIHGDWLGSRGMVWEAVSRHLGAHVLVGAGSSYFARAVAPQLAQKYAFAHNVYLDFLLAYGVLGSLLMVAAGNALRSLLPVGDGDVRPAWLLAGGAYLALFGLFDREHLDPLMLVGMLMLPGIVARVPAALRRRGLVATPVSPESTGAG